MKIGNTYMTIYKQKRPFWLLVIYKEDRHVALPAQSAVNATWRVNKINESTSARCAPHEPSSN